MVFCRHCNPEVAGGGQKENPRMTRIDTDGFVDPRNARKWCAAEFSAEARRSQSAEEPFRFSASSAPLRLIRAFSSRTALGARRRSPTPKTFGADRCFSHRAIAIRKRSHIVGTGRIWSDSAGFDRIFCFESEPPWLIWLRFALSTYRTFSQYPVTTYFVFLYLGSFRKKTFSHRHLSNSKCSFSYGKTMFYGFDRVHHLGSFCTLAILAGPTSFPGLKQPPTRSRRHVAADVSRRSD